MIVTTPVTVGTYGTTSTGYITFTWDHETVANKIEGGTWIPLATSARDWAEEIYSQANFRCDCHSTTYFDQYSRTVYSARFTNSGVETVGLPASTIRHYIDTAAKTIEKRLLDSVWGRVDYTSSNLTPEERDAREKERQRQSLREIIKSRHFPSIIVKPGRKPLPQTVDAREQRARETLRRVIGEDKWRSFVKHGFISVRARSGRTYQIFPSYKFTKVFEQGVLIERLCVVLRGNFPPTDSLIMRYLMILNDEEDFCKRAVKQGNWAEQIPQVRQQPQPLIEIARRIRVA